MSECSAVLARLLTHLGQPPGIPDAHNNRNANHDISDIHYPCSDRTRNISSHPLRAASCDSMLRRTASSPVTLPVSKYRNRPSECVCRKKPSHSFSRRATRSLRSLNICIVTQSGIPTASLEATASMHHATRRTQPAQPNQLPLDHAEPRQRIPVSTHFALLVHGSRLPPPLAQHHRVVLINKLPTTDRAVVL